MTFEAHYLSMVIIGVGTFLFGIFPVAFSFRVSRTYPFFLSLILCLGAGVLLATSLVHMLTEAQEKLKLSAQLYFCAGFLTLYVFDEISHYCVGTKQLETEENGGSSESSPLLAASHSSGSFSGKHEEKTNRQQEIAERETQSDRLDGKELWMPNPAAKTGLFIALFIHSVLEGISIGVQTKNSQIFLVLGAISFHKVVLSFCLGVELQNSGFRAIHLLTAIFIFSIGSPLGIFLGMTVTSLESGIYNIDAQLQAVAAGTLLYVAVFEVIPRERFKWQLKSNFKGTGIFQLIFMLSGFMCITAFHLFVGVSHDGDKPNANVTKKLH